MTRKKARKTTKKVTKKIITKWHIGKMKAHVREYCHDAEKEYLDQENFKKMTARLTTRTGWKLRELEGWLATTSFKTCASNKVMGDELARQEATLVGLVGGAKGARAKAVRGMREVIWKRVGGAKDPVITFAMLREWKDNKRDLCGGAKAGVTAAVLMAAAQEEIKVEMFEV